MVTQTFLPYTEFRLSKPLNDTQFDVLKKATTVLTGLALAGNDLTIGGQTVVTEDLGEDVQNFVPNITYGQLNRSNLKSKTRRSAQGRSTWEATATFYYNEDLNRSYDVIVKDSSGPRVLYVERNTGRKLVAVVTMGNVTDSGVDDDGNTTFDVTFWNASDVEPQWE